MHGLCLKIVVRIEVLLLFGVLRGVGQGTWNVLGLVVVAHLFRL